MISCDRYKSFELERVDDRGFFELHLPEVDSEFEYNFIHFTKRVNGYGEIHIHSFRVSQMMNFCYSMKAWIAI